MRKCLAFAQSIGEHTTVVIKQVTNRIGNNPFDPQAPLGPVLGTPQFPGTPQAPGTPPTPGTPQQGCTAPQPPSESQTQACPAGQTGTIVQTRSYSCVGSAWVPGAYQTTSNTCTGTPPPQGCTTPQPPSESQTLSCPAGQVGSITQTQHATAASAAPGSRVPFQTTSNTCTTPAATRLCDQFQQRNFQLQRKLRIQLADAQRGAGQRQHDRQLRQQHECRVQLFGCERQFAEHQSDHSWCARTSRHVHWPHHELVQCVLCQNNSGGSCTSSCSR